MTEIPINEIENVFIGQAQDEAGADGCTVFVFPDGCPAGLDVRGGGPASRESELLKPTASAQEIHALVLAGGSAYGLDAAGGVMQFLEEKNIGFDVAADLKVPLVCQASLFDLTVGDPKARPDKKMGYEAAKSAFVSTGFQEGNYGAGCGASVGKICGMDHAMKSGIGSYAVQIGELKIGAVAAVNALGDIYDCHTGKKIAGLLSEDKKGFGDTLDVMSRSTEKIENKFTGNTTLGVVLTNAAFDKTALCRIALMAQDGYARSIKPVHTSVDGDSIYAVSAGDLEADADLVGILAAEVMSEAITRAVKSAGSAYGLPSYADMKKQMKI